MWLDSHLETPIHQCHVAQKFLDWPPGFGIPMSRFCADLFFPNYPNSARRTLQWVRKEYHVRRRHVSSQIRVADDQLFVCQTVDPEQHFADNEVWRNSFFDGDFDCLTRDNNFMAQCSFRIQVIDCLYERLCIVFAINRGSKCLSQTHCAHALCLMSGRNVVPC